MHKKVSVQVIMILVTAAILTVPPLMLQVSYAQSNQDLQTVLDVHNQERASVGVKPLTWSDSLAAGAQTWADQVATTGVFDHDPDNAYGENMAGFNPSLGPSAPGEGVDLWVAEKSSYDAQTNTCTAVCGHYTQMVWQNSRDIGCGIAPPGGGGLHYSVLVCRYDPSGNYPGQLPFGQGAGAPPANQAVGEEDTGFPPADQGAAAPFDDQGAAPPVDEGGGDNGGGEKNGGN